MVSRSWWAVAGAVALCALFLAAQAQPARAAASWVSAPALAPPPPSGAGPPPYPVPIGYVGDIQFWQPNRGLLITKGNAVVPMGLYAYDGVNWHQLSTVCGGIDGRIAWAGPDEFWTIADQRPGQIGGGTLSLNSVSLCHFQNGQVVGSYALPLGQPTSYQQMYAAACDAPSDCWFGGLSPNGKGAFHLHWDGTNLSVVYGSADHSIASMTVDRGQIFESVELAPTDFYRSSEDPAHPPLMHLIAPNDAANPFHSLYPQDPNCGQFCPPLPEYGSDPSSGLPVAPVTLNGLALSSDWRAGAADPQLWAAAGLNPANVQSGAGSAHPVVLRYADGAWTQVVPNLLPLSALQGDTPAGQVGLVPGAGGGATPASQSVAADPGQSAAWIAVTTTPADSEAHVDHIALTGTTPPATVTRVTLGTPQGVGPQGPASAIACPAANDCWVATSEGWLFHLTDGTQLPQDSDPNFAGVITFRPSDGGVPSVLPDQPTLGQDLTPPPTVVTPTPSVHHRRRGKALVTHMGRSRLVHRTTLVLSFTLTAKARVQLIARRHHQIVAETSRLVLKAGRHTLKLLLDPHRWPTQLALKAKAVTTSARA